MHCVKFCTLRWCNRLGLVSLDTWVLLEHQSFFVHPTIKFHSENILIVFFFPLSYFIFTVTQPFLCFFSFFFTFSMMIVVGVILIVNRERYVESKSTLFFFCVYDCSEAFNISQVLM